MTPEQFCYWLQGFCELNHGRMPDAPQWLSITEHLATVFNKVTPKVKKEDISLIEILRKATEEAEEITAIPPLFRSFEERGKDRDEPVKTIKFRRADLDEMLQRNLGAENRGKVANPQKQEMPETLNDLIKGNERPVRSQFISPFAPQPPFIYPRAGSVGREGY